MSQRYQQCVMGLVLAAGAILAPFAGSAAPLLTAIAQSENPLVIDSQSSGSASADSFSARAGARAFTQFGLLRAFGRAAQVPGLSNRNAFAAAGAHWNDDVSIDAPGLAGQAGTATVHYRIDGSMAFNSSASARSNYSFFVKRGELFENISVGNWQIGVGPSGADFLNRSISATFPIVFGAERQWLFTISLQSSLFGVDVAESAVVDLSDTALWEGISDVRDAQGKEVAGYGVRSASGTDWAQPVVAQVPEPSALVLCCVGAVAVGAVSLRRRNKVRAA